MTKNIILTFLLIVIIVITYFNYYQTIRNSDKKIQDSSCSIVLYEGGKVESDENLSGQFIFPPDTRSYRTIKIKSKLSEDLNNIKVLAGCSCTDAVFNYEQLTAGDSGELVFVYDSSGKRGDNVINLTLTSDNYPPFKLTFGCQISENPSSLYVNVSPQSLNINEIWSSGIDLTYPISVIFNEKINQDQFKISVSKPYIYANINNKKLSANTADIVVRILNPPAGEISERITLSYIYEGNQYESFIPIYGRIKRGYEVTPSIVNFGELSDKDEANATVTICISERLTEKPTINIDGDWEIVKILTKDKIIQVQLALRDSIKSKYCAGRLIVGSNIGNIPLSIPIFATIQNSN
ncbi:hypothetical protein AMJ83_11480 [candidate division WOR_3 bacterium SM23_42]|uniref:Uncharacterized protein n=1 Tax=candidate division WOR_3 bacterium SM23_42 TaxID=1703779 RepID=A0A0S8FNR9_UNCW3|nr:MAG: hypothetical protein AMJ83_11480 [candidate division WOR_3 bacterium SM23_42]